MSRIWRAFGLRPHRSETFQLSNDPLLVDKVRDIVGLYLIPPITRWCYAWTRRARFRRWIAASRVCRCCPARLKPLTHDYKRNGTTTLFAAFDIATGSVIGKCWPRHRAIEFRVLEAD